MTCLATVAGLIALILGSGVRPAYADWIRDQQWQLSALHARAAWRYSTGTGVVVAVLDSGVDATAPDLSGQVLSGADFVDGRSDGRVDYVGHGSTVAALIAGHQDPDGVAGLAPGARILPVRVLDQRNRYADAGIVAAGVRWAVRHGARVVNLSLGGARSSPTLTAAIQDALARGVVVVACTGNVEPGGPTQVWYPAAQAGVIAVSGLAPDSTGRLTSWSGALTGPATVLTAPAAWLIGVKPGGYWRVAGTSFAAALVAATVALVWARWPKLPAAQVVNRLIRTATDLGPPGRDAQYGYGEVDPLAALTASVPATSANPLLAPSGRLAEPSTPPADRLLAPLPATQSDIGPPAVSHQTPAVAVPEPMPADGSGSATGPGPTPSQIQPVVAGQPPVAAARAERARDGPAGPLLARLLIVAGIILAIATAVGWRRATRPD